MSSADISSFYFFKTVATDSVLNFIAALIRMPRVINPEDPQLISLNTERRVTPCDIATNQPFRSNYHLDNSTLVFKHPADTEGGGVQKCICACLDVYLCMCVCVKLDETENHRKKKKKRNPMVGMSVVSFRKQNINLLICLQCFLCRH